MCVCETKLQMLCLGSSGVSDLQSGSSILAIGGRSGLLDSLRLCLLALVNGENVPDFLGMRRLSTVHIHTQIEDARMDKNNPGAEFVWFILHNTVVVWLICGIHRHQPHFVSIFVHLC